ncbi:MAG: low temperature requirement protein A [Parasporobacterium sp.]|nr:low temperature requirement protein A [Parasporobacterium sp.]
MFTEEKKVEYIELIYDLIFVYLIGQSNELLHEFEGGFFSAGTYLTYLLSTVVILQIWYQSSLFINRYGSNSMLDYIGLFINMYLLYFMATGTRADWDNYYMRYNIAWGLILLNLAVQYYLQYRKRSKTAPWELAHIRSRIWLLLVQAIMIFVSIPFYFLAHFPLSWISLILGFIGSVFTRKIDSLVPVNFEHLTERVMLYIVLTFGEMIVAISAYFNGAFSLSSGYYSLLAFLIVVGLFLSYGYLYDHVIDRSLHNTGSVYMMLHIGLLVAMNNITAALTFMRRPEVDAISKNILITVSFLVFFLFLFLISCYAKECDKPKKPLILKMSGASALFVLGMILLYNNGFFSIALTVLYVFSILGMLIRAHKSPI